MYTLPELPYKYSDLEPYIDAVTMEIHHSRHHQTYVDNLNKALSGLEGYSEKSIEDLLMNLDSIPAEARQSVINNGGGHYNHSFFWKIMSPGKNNPDDFLTKMLSDKFGSLDQFKGKFNEKAMSVFGSGWAFLVVDKNKQLNFKRHSFQNSPIMQGSLPILGVDVWEHAYYLKYQNKRKDYLDAWWNIVNWTQVSQNLEVALK